MDMLINQLMDIPTDLTYAVHPLCPLEPLHGQGTKTILMIGISGYWSVCNGFLYSYS